MKTYKIEDLYAYAYESAIENVATIVNLTLGTHYFFARDWAKLEQLADKLGIDFDENGELVGSAICLN